MSSRPPMPRLVAAELLKVRSTRVVWGLLAGMLVLALLALVGRLATADGVDAPLASTEGIRAIVGSAGAGWIFVFALGIVSSAGELKHGTAVQSFLAVPARVPVIAAKLAAAALIGLAFAAVCAAFVVAVGLPWAASKQAAPSLGDGELWAVLAGVSLSTVLYGALGVALGALIRHQVAALLIGIGWFLVAESAVTAALPEVGRWLPGGAASALSRSAGTAELLPMGWGGLLFTAYVAGFAAAAMIATRRRDVSP